MLLVCVLAGWARNKLHEQFPPLSHRGAQYTYTMANLDRVFMMRKTLSAGFLSVLIIAGFALESQHAEASDLPARARDFVNAMGLDVVAIMADKTITNAQGLDRFHQLFRQNFDIKTISSFSLGRYRGLATSDQKLECESLIEDLMVRSYYMRFKNFGGGSFQNIEARADSDHDALVMTEILFRRKPVNVEWRVRERNSRLGIIDVAIEGVSMVVAQRQEFSSVIMAKGGNIDAFLQALRSNNTYVASIAP